MLNWAYIAGFFDGEGCVNYATSSSVNTHRIRLTFSQAQPRGYKLLGELKEFLESQGCRVANIATSGYIKDKTKQGWQLQIAAKDSTKKIMEAMMPYLHIKKLEVQDALRRQKLFPPRSTRVNFT
jgi:hypothetical protein